MVPVARKNLLADKIRLLISIGGVTFAVLLILIVQSLYWGFQKEVTSFIERVHADVWVMQSGTNEMFHSFSIIPASLKNQIEPLEGVQEVTGVFGRYYLATFKGGEANLLLMSIDRPRGEPPMEGIDEAPGPGEIIIDNVTAKKTGLGPGDSLTIEGKQYTVKDVEHVGNLLISQFALISPEDGRTLIKVPDSVGYYLLNLSDPAQAPAVAQQVKSTIPEVNAMTGKEFATANRDEIGNSFLPIIGVLLAIGFVVGIAVVGLMIYTATVERAREYAVMKALGASGLDLYRIVITQSVILGLAGFAAGIPLTYFVSGLAQAIVPEFVTLLRWEDVLLVLAASVAMSVIASYIPIQRVARIDPAAVFRA